MTRKYALCAVVGVAAGSPIAWTLYRAGGGGRDGSQLAGMALGITLSAALILGDRWRKPR